MEVNKLIPILELFGKKFDYVKSYKLITETSNIYKIILKDEFDVKVGKLDIFYIEDSFFITHVKMKKTISLHLKDKNNLSSCFTYKVPIEDKCIYNEKLHNDLVNIIRPDIDE